ncbi:hypothetical protein R1sor_021864 [Riccia sorocarpa]|uniref:VDE lipocalin domain-containing protein n=1 Tax=Riccia sorocarpa TaxID=122646 RepID=A0ABD3GIZ4_9MARC
MASSLLSCGRAASVSARSSSAQRKPSASTFTSCCCGFKESSSLNRVEEMEALSSCSVSLGRSSGIDDHEYRDSRKGFENSGRMRRSVLGIRASSPRSQISADARDKQETRSFQLGLSAVGNEARKAVGIHVLGAMAVGFLIFGIPSAQAVDALKTCACLLKECRVELARCIADPGCAANVACLQTCNNRPDETECQIKCGDLFENSVVDQFNDCAVSRKKCVPQKGDEGLFPVPPPSAMVQEFNTQDFKGKWYISSGLNRTFDTFDCQLHEFSSTPNSVTGNLTWRISTPDGAYFTRSAVQNFVQDEKQPGLLKNHGNEFLHYQDDWYILASQIKNKPDDFVLVYYRGSNDAWDGYGGAVVYTRSRTVPKSIIPELKRAAKSVGLDYNKFSPTDNTCGPEPPLLARLETTLEKGEKVLENTLEKGEEVLVKEVKEIEETVENVGKKEFMFLSKGANELRREEEELLQSLGKEEKALLDKLKMGVTDIENLFGNAIPIRKLR